MHLSFVSSTPIGPGKVEVYWGLTYDESLKCRFFFKIVKANRKVPDGTPRSAASHLGLFYLPMSHKRDAPTLNELM